MDAVLRRRTNFQQHLFRGAINAFRTNGEPAEVMHVHGGVIRRGHGVLKIDPVVLLKIRIQGDAQQAGFPSGVGLEVDQFGQFTGPVRMPQLHLAGAFGKEHATIPGDGHLHTFANARGEQAQFQIGIRRQLGVGCGG